MAWNSRVPTAVAPQCSVSSAIKYSFRLLHKTIDGFLSFVVAVKTTLKVGRVETAVALLRHFERLAIPHMPRDTTVDINRSIHQAVRVGKRIRKRLLQAGKLALVTPKLDNPLSTVLSTDQQQCRTTLEVEIPHDDYLDLAKQAPMCSPGKFHGSQEHVGMPSPVAPFCVDTSAQTFRSFLELIKAIRERKRPVPALSARTPAGAEKADSSTSPKGKRRCEKQSVADSIGPESCVKHTTSNTKVKPFNKHVPKQQCADPDPIVNGFTVASRQVTLEVLRSTLKLLKVNLFHLVRVATMRRSCRGRGENISIHQVGGERVSIDARVESEGYQGSGLAQCRAGDTQGPTEKMSGSPDRAKFLGSRLSSDGIENVGKDKRRTSSVSKGLTFEDMGQTGCQGDGENAEDVHGMIGELFDELKTLLEEDVVQEDPETDAALSVQVRTNTY